MNIPLQPTNERSSKMGSAMEQVSNHWEWDWEGPTPNLYPWNWKRAESNVVTSGACRQTLKLQPKGGV